MTLPPVIDLTQEEAQTIGIVSHVCAYLVLQPGRLQCK